MIEARSSREAIADGVMTGYAEAMVAAGAWRGRMRRGWREPVAITPAQAEAVFDRIARRYPGSLVQ
jgi:hypothetical protein